jgi:hypothetical protein
MQSKPDIVLFFVISLTGREVKVEIQVIEVTARKLEM